MLELKNICYSYLNKNGETQAIKNVNFEVLEGDFVAILGPSGSGKTTILSLISGLLTPTHGQILLENKLFSPKDNLTGYMFQKDLLLEWRTVEKNIALSLEVQRKKITRRIKKEFKIKHIKQNQPHLLEENNTLKKYQPNFDIPNLSGLNDKDVKTLQKAFIANEFKTRKKYAAELLKKYGLWDFRKKYPHQLSGGMRQRVALIRTLVQMPKLLLLDEPFSALDYQTRLNLCDDVANIISSEGKTAILVTHDITEALSMANKIIVLTKRPATVKNIHVIEISRELTPFKRREQGAFLQYFEVIWKELQGDE